MEILHLAFIAYPLIVYNYYVWYSNEGNVDAIRWQSELLFPTVWYVLVSIGLATYHSFRNTTQQGKLNLSKHCTSPAVTAKIIFQKKKKKIEEKGPHLQLVS
jgi:hypothetical protein